MLGEAQRRAAELAVSRYGVNPASVQKLVQAMLDSPARGEGVDLLDALAKDKLITAAQFKEMRQTLANGDDVAFGNDEVDIYSAVTLPPGGRSVGGEVPDLRRLGEYRILRRLGEGGMGAVFLAYQESKKLHVAIKILGHKEAMNQAAVDRFYREAKSGALLNHPNIVRNLAAGQDKSTGLHYLVMEYVSGRSCDRVLERDGKLPIGDAVHIVLDIARALEHAHSRNIVHRDIKPANILITQSGLAKLADLGLAKRIDEQSHLTGARQGFGTPYYMPYEQAMNAKAVDGRSDIYALGATLYHLLVGDVPFPGGSPVEIIEKKEVGRYVPASVVNPEVPRVLDTILARMLAKEPRHRYQTASELIVDLERSQLAAAVPSFVDRDLAMRDPVVRQRLVTAMQATAMQMNIGDDTPAEELRWYVRYRQSSGHWRKAKLSVHEIISRFRQGRFPAEIEVSPHLNGDFRPLLAFSEFQDLTSDMVRTKTPEESAKPFLDDEPVKLGNRLRWLLAGAAGAGIVCVVLITLLVMLARG